GDAEAFQGGQRRLDRPWSRADVSGELCGRGGAQQLQPAMDHELKPFVFVERPGARWRCHWGIEVERAQDCLDGLEAFSGDDDALTPALSQREREFGHCGATRGD